MKKKITNLILVILLLIGLGLLLYPSVSDYWNSLVQSKAIATYMEEIEDLDEDKYLALFQEAEDYNEALLKNKKRWIMTDEDKQNYYNTFVVSNTGVMGYIEIPQINVSLPIYHGVSEEVLQVAIGHIESTSIPIGGEGTHSVLSGHRGLPSAKIFTDLDKMVVGDVFMIKVLDKTLTYEVDQILIVEPDDIDALEIDAKKDYCTLVTCTPYGVNSHRLLIRGHRIENALEKQEIRVVSEAIQIEPLVVAPIVAAPMLFILLLVLIFKKK